MVTSYSMIFLRKGLKILLKTVLVFPFTFVLWVFYLEQNLIEWHEMTILTFLISGFLVGMNVFEYKGIKGMENQDFLESSHTLLVEYSQENWQKIITMLNLDFEEVDIDFLITTENYYRVAFKFSPIDSLFTFKKKKDFIELKIEREIFKFLPDWTRNYCLLKKIENSLKS